MPHIHNALHRFTAVQDAYRKAVGEAQADFSGIERGGETLTPTLNLWERAEWATLRGEVLWSAHHAQDAVAAEFGFVGIRNPADSGLLCVIELAYLFTVAGTAARFQVTHGAISASDVDGSEQVVPRDTRLNLTGISRLVKIHGAGPALIGNDALDVRATAAAFTPVESTTRWILTPGFEQRYYLLSTNVAISATIQGYTRTALPGELV